MRRCSCAALQQLCLLLRLFLCLKRKGKDWLAVGNGGGEPQEGTAGVRGRVVALENDRGSISVVQSHSVCNLGVL